MREATTPSSMLAGPHPRSRSLGGRAPRSGRRRLPCALPPSREASAFALLRRTAVAFGGGWSADRRSLGGGGCPLPFWLWRWAILASLPGLLLISSCRADSTRARVILLAFDGADPRAVDLLMSEGGLPHFTRLRRQGAYGRLQGFRPLLGPAVSTTIATGKRPEAHGIGNIVAVDRTTGEPWPVTSDMRRAKALWNILSDANRSVAVVGWGASWPAETVRGSMVSDRFGYDALLETGPGEPAGGTSVSPAALESTVRPCVKRPQDLTFQEADAFLDVTPGDFRRPFDVEDDLSHFKWALATAGTSTCVGSKLWNQQKPATLMVQIDAIDVASHLFGHLFRASGLRDDPAEQQKRYGRAVEQLYVYADGVIGEFMKTMDDESSLLVLSGHGFELNALPDDRSSTAGTADVPANGIIGSRASCICMASMSSPARDSRTRRFWISLPRCWH